MPVPFFQAVDEANLLNRLNKIVVETGAFIPLNTDLRTILYLSDKAEERVRARANAAGKT
jgi:hypothetical protein